MRKLNIGADYHETDALFASLDEDGSGELELTELKGAVRKLQDAGRPTLLSLSLVSVSVACILLGSARQCPRGFAPPARPPVYPPRHPSAYSSAPPTRPTRRSARRTFTRALPRPSYAAAAVEAEAEAETRLIEEDVSRLRLKSEHAQMVLTAIEEARCSAGAP